MPSNPPVLPPFLKLPSLDGEYRRNWYALTLWTKAVSPYACCYNPSGSLGTITAGSTTYVNWTPTSNQDDWNFLNGNSDPTWIRFPYDGLYDIQYRMLFTDNITTGVEFQTFIDYANTSNTGFSAVSFASGTGTTSVREKFDTGDIIKVVNATYLNYVANANDLARVGFRIVSSQNIASSSIVMASFRLAMPVPKRFAGGGTV